MRPLHSLFVVVALLLLAAGGWLLLESNDPSKRITAAGPAPSVPERPATQVPTDLRALDDVPLERRSEDVVSAGAAAAPDALAAQASPTAALSGRVLDARGRPVAAARVLLSEGSAGFLRGAALDAESAARLFAVREAQTDAEGRFRFEDVAADALRVAVRAAGFAPYDAADVPRPASSTLADIVLEQGVRLAGRVVDSAGRPAAGVRVLRVGSAQSGPFRFGGQSAHVASSAADGTFEVDVLAVGPWSLAFRSERHPDAALEGRTDRSGESVEGLLVQLAEAAQIGGRVSGGSSEARDLTELRVSAVPVPDEDLPEAEARSAQVAADGSFAVQGVRAGRRYVLRAVESEGPLGDDMPFAFLPGVAAPVQADAGESGVVLVLSPEAALRFAVVDARSGAPLEEFRVEAGLDWPQPMLDEQGRVRRVHPGGLVRVGDLRPRSSGERASLRIEALGYRSYAAADLKLTAGLDTDLGTIALEPAPILTVRVLDAVTGAPIAGADALLGEVVEPEVAAGSTLRRATVSIHGGGPAGRVRDGARSEAQTDEEGRARLNALTDSDVRLRVRASGYAPAIGAPFRCSGEAEEREVRLTRGGAVVVHLFDAAGEPLAGGRVEHRAFHDDEGLPEFRSPALSDEQGRARFEHLAPGRHRFRRAGSESGGVFNSGGNTFAVMIAGMDEEGDDWVQVDVLEGGEHEVEIHLPLSLAVHGRVTEAGSALAGATLSLVAAPPAQDGMPAFRGFAGGPQVESDVDGRWRFDDVEPGAYTLRISHPERAMPSEVELEVVDNEVQRDVDLDVAILEGRVLDPAGKPLAGVEVWSERAREAGAPRAVRVMAFSGTGGGATMTLDSGGGTPVRTRSDGDGRYVLRGVVPGVELEVRGKAEGMQPGRSEPLRLAVDEHRRGVDLTLETAGWIEVEGRFTDGSPAASLLVTARFEGGADGVEPQTILLDDTGRGRVEGLAPGPWRLTGRVMGPAGDGKTPGELSVDVVAGSGTPATITAP
jgi:protocatechuate 3,4-dioxygenase beta subunit